MPSHLTRGAWIEIFSNCTTWIIRICRTSHEVRGLKYRCLLYSASAGCCRTSHEVRGLKWHNLRSKIQFLIVAPHTRCVDWNRTAWARTTTLTRRTSHEVRGLKSKDCAGMNIYIKSHLTRGAWIEICSFISLDHLIVSHLTRGAWIEISGNYGIYGTHAVAPHTRCVDWNNSDVSNHFVFLLVAPHTRCVDWNNFNELWITTCGGRTSHEVRGLK